MTGLQKAGGIAALIEAIAYITGFALFIGLLGSAGSVGPVEKLAFIQEHQSALLVGILATYIGTGSVLVVLAIALHERLEAGSPALMKVATAFGLVWAGLIVGSGMIAIVGMEAVVDLYAREPDRAATVWLSVGIVQDGLGGGIEIIGGIWVLLVSCAALASRTLPKLLNYLGLAIGVVGLLTVSPALEVLVDVFGLAQIVWFGWLGYFMVRGGNIAVARQPVAAWNSEVAMPVSPASSTDE